MAEPEAFDRLARDWQALLEALPPERVNSPRWFCAPGMPRPDTPVQLFAELEDVRLGWRELRGRPEVGKLAGRFVTAAWTLKDLLAHVASWATEFRHEVETVARGEGFDYAIPYVLTEVGPTEWNHAEVDKRRAKSLEELFEELETQTLALEDAALGLPPATLWRETDFPFAPSGDPKALWRGALSQVILMKCFHDRHHLGRLQQWLTSQPPEP
ncbi:MAG: DinB family protein [Terriglobia bacterium]